MRSTGDPAALANDVRALVRAEDASLPVDSVMTMEERVAESLAGPRTYMVFLIGFALCALAIAGVGLFGVLSYTTAQRTREIGLRTALGAQRADVLALVGRQAMADHAERHHGRTLAAFVLSRSLAALLYGVSARDAISFRRRAACLMLVSIAACAIPAWRATRIDPIEALRASSNPNAQLPTTNHSQIPTPDYQSQLQLGVGNWEWLGVGSWALGVIRPARSSTPCRPTHCRRSRLRWRRRCSRRGSAARRGCARASG